MEQNESFELEEMRQQHALLKGKLNKQSIVNDAMLEKAMKRNLSKLNKRMRWLSVLLIFVIIDCPYTFYKILNTSLAFAICLFIVLLIVGVMHYFQMRILPKGEDFYEDISTLDARMVRFLWWKKMRLIIGLGLCVPMFIWLFLELSGEGSWLFLIAGALLGLLIGLRQTTEMSREVKSIRRDLAKLERLKNNEELND